MKKSKAQFATLSSVALAASAWMASAWMARAEEAGDTRAPVNLQVLPADTSRAGVRSLMKQYERDLGVSCGYCHVEDRDTGIIDYDADDNPRKHTARLMIAMLQDINDKHLARLEGDRRYAQPVTCGSCHQGRSSPPVFEP